jgi:hypothetical protein
MNEPYLPDKIIDSKNNPIKCPKCGVYPGQLHKDICGRSDKDDLPILRKCDSCEQ